jgi:hypothetical protein
LPTLALIYFSYIEKMESHLHVSRFLQESTRREALSAGVAAVGAAFLPLAANAAAGESPRFSVFGLVGDGTSYSEGAAYGTDQSGKLYSPYSVYGDAGGKSLYQPATDKAYAAKKKAVLAETKKRLAKLPGYVKKQQWMEVTGELDRFMYETRGAVVFLATTPEQKKAATAFFKTLEVTDTASRRKNQEVAAAAAADTIPKLEAFTALL